MTALILAQKKLFALPPMVRIRQAADYFLELNQKGMVSIITILFLSLSALIYLVSIYTVFGAGLRLQAYENVIAELENSVTSQESKLQELRLDLSGNYDKLLLSMERISVLKYIREENFTASLPVIQP